MSTSKGCGSWGYLLAALTVVGCGGNSVALDRQRNMQVAEGAADSDGVIVRSTLVGQVSVDDARLYWVNERTIYGCLKSGCGPSLVNYYTVDHGPNGGDWDGVAWLAAEGDDVIWASHDWIKSCPRSGCSGEPRVLGSAHRDLAYAVNDEVILRVAQDGLHRMPRAGGDWSFLAPTDGAPTGGLGVHDGYAYWIDSNADGSSPRLLRVAVDRAGEVEPLVDLVGLYYGSDLAFDSAFVYFTDTRDSGAVLRCPLAGCQGAPEDVVGPVRQPTRLAVDERGLCLMHATTPFEQVAECAAGSRPPLKLERVFGGALGLTMDADYLYAVHREGDPVGSPNPSEVYNLSRWAR